MWTILGALGVGILLGRVFLRNRKDGVLSVAVEYIVRLLLFSLGMEVGADRAIMGNLGTLGVAVLGLTVAALAGSVVMSGVLWVVVRGRGEGAEGEEVRVGVGKMGGWRERVAFVWGGLKGSVVVVAFFAVGVVVGMATEGMVDFHSLSLTRYVLYALLLCVGMTIGADAGFFRQVGRLDRKLMLLPLMTACGTFAGVALWWLFTRRYLLADSLALGSGFAYYSLSGIFMTEMRGAELGTVALLCNLFREILALLLIPPVARFVNPLSAISMGGATTFDTTLPVIMQSAGKKYLPVAAFHGILLDLSVPFFVTFFCSLAD